MGSAEKERRYRKKQRNEGGKKTYADHSNI